jgi:hypothetical protein
VTLSRYLFVCMCVCICVMHTDTEAMSFLFRSTAGSLSSPLRALPSSPPRSTPYTLKTNSDSRFQDS